MTTETDLLKLALLAYEAAAEPELWTHFLERYARVLRADAAFLQLHDFASQKSHVMAAFGLGPRVESSYHEYYSKLNIWRQRGEELYHVGRVLQDEEICDRATLRRSEFYNDYLLKIGLTRSMNGVVAREGRQALSLPAMRRDDGEGFGDRERAIARELLPHLARANTIRQRLDILRAGEEILDGLPYGVAFVTAEGRVGLFNLGRAGIVIDPLNGPTSFPPAPDTV